jgi:hypothetical protein
MIIAMVASVIAIPATHLDVLPLNDNHPAVSHDYTPAESFASNTGVQFDILKLEQLVGAPFEKNWSTLPTNATVKRNIWPGPYWPTYNDGINVRWAGNNSLSAVEKYAKAFGLDAVNLSNAVSRKSGIDSQSGAKKCKSDSDCEDDPCAIRRGETEGRCIPGWFGICHAWVPVAIVEDEAKNAVTINDVTFEPMDTKALITQIYDTANIGTIFTGRRCNLKNPPKDEYGRYVNEECRDITPEFFHLTLTNMVGRLGRSFVADVFSDYEVWNHPSIGYEILHQRKWTQAEVMGGLYNTTNSTVYPFNPTAKQLLFVITKFDYVVESDENISGLVEKYTTSRYYEYILELDDNDNIIGGEWVGDNHDNHPDFIYVPVGPPNANTEILGGIKYSQVKEMIRLSQLSIN